MLVPQFVFGSITVEPLPEGTTLESLGLIPGKTGGVAIIVTAEAKLADGWRQQGHPLAAIRTRDMIADHRTNTLDVTLSIDPGPIANFGRVEVTGTEAVNVASWSSGGRGSTGGFIHRRSRGGPRTRLRDLGVFESVRVMPDEALDPDGTIPITITVAERKRACRRRQRQLFQHRRTGASRSSGGTGTSGAAPSNLHFRGSVSRLLSGAFDPDYRLAGTFKKPAVFDPMTDFTLRVEGYRETTDAYRVTALEGEAGLNHIFSDTLSGSLGVEVARSQHGEQTGKRGSSADDADRQARLGHARQPSRPERGLPGAGHGSAGIRLSYQPAVRDFQRRLCDLLGVRRSRPVCAGRARRRDGARGQRCQRMLPPTSASMPAAPDRSAATRTRMSAPRDGADTNVGGRSSLVLLAANSATALTTSSVFVGFIDAGNAFASVRAGSRFQGWGRRRAPLSDAGRTAPLRRGGAPAARTRRSGRGFLCRSRTGFLADGI